MAELDDRCDEFVVGLETTEDDDFIAVVDDEEVFDGTFGLCKGLFNILSTVRGDEETFDDEIFVAVGVVGVIVVVAVVVDVVRRASLSNEPAAGLSRGFFAEN